MPYDIRIVRSREFVRLDADGHFDLAATRTLFADLIWTCARSQIGRVLLDLREAKADLTVAQLVSLANVTHDVAPPPLGHRIALLTRAETQFERASLLATTVQEKGWDMTAFHSFEDALAWLSE